MNDRPPVSDVYGIGPDYADHNERCSKCEQKGIDLPPQMPRGRQHRGCDACPAMWDEGWVDLIVPAWVWDQISPQSDDGESGGYLCAHCLTSRLVAAGISDVPVRAYGRPFWTGSA